jgi:uncharacterized membrane protein SpoIIM required for sporulation
MKKRIIIIVVIFVVLVVISTLSTLTPMSQQDATKTYSDLNSTVTTLRDNDVLWPYIFGNNLIVALMLFVPFIGPVLGFYEAYMAGLAYAAGGIANNVNPVAVWLMVFLTPIPWLEYTAYSIAIAGSLWLSVRILQHGAKHELGNTAKFVAVCAIVLVVSAYIEAALIYAA